MSKSVFLRFPTTAKMRVSAYGEDSADCPKCEAFFHNVFQGQEIVCPNCKHIFTVVLDEKKDKSK